MSFTVLRYKEKDVVIHYGRYLRLVLTVIKGGGARFTIRRAPGLTALYWSRRYAAIQRHAALSPTFKFLWRMRHWAEQPGS